MSEKAIKTSAWDSAIAKATAKGASAQDRIDAALSIVDTHLNAIQARPFMWGGSPESIETVVIELLVVRALLLGVAPEWVNSPTLRGILRRRFGERSTSAAGSLHSETIEEIADIMGQYIAAERKRVGVPSKVKQKARARHWKRTPRGSSR